MFAPPVQPFFDFIASSTALCEAVMCLHGALLHEELGRIARALLACPYGMFEPAGAVNLDDGSAGAHVAGRAGQLRQDVDCDGHTVGCYKVFGRSNFTDADRQHLLSLGQMTASLLRVYSLAQRSTHAYAQVEAQLAHQAQILDQIQESVLTLDLDGYITSWNKGAERLFGYSAIEAIGNHVLFLYVDEDAGFPDNFAERGGSTMEVRRRKKSGAVFWASMSLMPLRDVAEHPVGLIAYLSDITERKQAEERLHHMAYYDALTDLPNRVLLTKLLEQALMVAQRNASCACVVFVDLNRFKWINESLGRQIGDELLRQVARRFRSALHEEHIVARLSGDEFVVALLDIRQHFEATSVAQTLQGALGAPFLIDGHDVRVGASIGISVYPQDGLDAETLLRLAGIATARAKLSHAHPEENVAFYSLDMNLGMHERMRIESGLRQALGNGELLLHYQPKF